MSTAGHMEPARDQSVRPPPAAVDPASSTSASVDKSNKSPFPLNFRRLIGPYIKAITRAVGLPTTRTADETRVMINGKIKEMGRDPRNVQVIVARDSHAWETLSPRDVDGILVDVGAPEISWRRRRRW